MNLLLTTILISILAFLGQAIGYLLIIISPEELEPGKKHFKFFEAFFLFIIIFLGLFFFLKFSYINIILLVLGIILGIFLKKVYPYFAGLLFSINSYLFPFAILIFIYGLFYGTLNQILLKKNIKKFIINTILFIIFAAIIIFTKLDLTMLFLGALLSQLYLRLETYKKH